MIEVAESGFISVAILFLSLIDLVVAPGAAALAPASAPIEFEVNSTMIQIPVFMYFLHDSMSDVNIEAWENLF